MNVRLPTSARLAVGALLAALAFALGLGAWRGAQLDRELSRLRDELHAHSHLQTEHRRLRQALPSDAEWEGLRSDHTRMEEVRKQLAELRTRPAGPTALPSAAPSTAPSSPSPPQVPVSVWRQAGRATPEAALYTTLWAASQGNIDIMAQSILLDERARAKAQRLIEQLRPTASLEASSPEHLIALLTVKEVPLGSLQLLSLTQPNPTLAMIRVRLTAPEGAAKVTNLTLRQTSGQWRLVVPEAAVDAYTLQLTGRSAPKT
ncbi:MAG: hypothetical protein JNN01_06120 [Opitutaceae bacterium]|nr:hypothetical protein [Opitutaceae bacterium]